MTNYGRIKRGYMTADSYATIPKALALHQGLSLEAKGLFSILAACRDGLPLKQIVTLIPEDESAVLTALAELDEAGYSDSHVDSEVVFFTPAMPL